MASCCVGVHTPTPTKKKPIICDQNSSGLQNPQEVWQVVKNVLKCNSTKLVKGLECGALKDIGCNDKGRRRLRYGPRD